VNVLLTGANGFIGSHILARLLACGHGVSVLLRKTSNTALIAGHLDDVEVHYGSLSDVDSLRRAVHGVEAIVHCAGKTKAVRRDEYYRVNAVGTRNLVEACRSVKEAPGHIVLISSLAASGPGTRSSPVTEDDEPRPVSHYGRSKLMGEHFLREQSPAPCTVLRPAVVYGPGDRDLLMMFRIVRAGFAPLIAGEKFQVSVVFAADVAEAVTKVLGTERSFGRTYHVAHPEPEAIEGFLSLAAELMDIRPFRIHVPTWALLAVCVWQEVRARITATPSILNLQKMQEYRAPGWVCASQKMERELGFTPPTSLRQGISATLAWYERNGWL